jgi:hypothetical protein
VLYLDYLLLSLKTDKEVPMGPSYISSLLSNEYNKYFPKKNQPAASGDSLDGETNPFPYFYPRVQYKIVRGGPLLTAVNEGCRLLWDIYDKLDAI